MNRILPSLLCTFVVVGCAHIQALTTNKPSDWDNTLYRARAAVDAHNYFAAGKLLDEYVRTHPGTRESSEIAFWKAAYTLDPANEHGSLGDGIAQLDSYLASNPDGLYRTEASLLRRTAAAALGVSNVARTTPGDITPAAGKTRDTVVVVNKSRDEEIANLKDQLAKSKDELAKVTAELERIKKRLANPNG